MSCSGNDFFSFVLLRIARATKLVIGKTVAKSSGSSYSEYELSSCIFYRDVWIFSGIDYNFQVSYFAAKLM